MNIVSNIIYSFILGLSGAMMPGPVLAVTITETLKRGFMAAVFIVCGHSLLELVTVILLSIGVGTGLNNTIAAGIIGIIGGGVLLWMTIGILKESGVRKFDLPIVALLAISIHAVLLTLNSYDALKKIFISPVVLINKPTLLFGLLGILVSGAILWMGIGRKKDEVGEVNFSEVKSVRCAHQRLRLMVHFVHRRLRLTVRCAHRRSISPFPLEIPPAPFGKGGDRGGRGDFNRLTERKMGPFSLGVVVSLSNPYWTFWWLTVGLKLVSDAVTGGIPIVSAIYFGHILSDFAWYSLVGAFVVFGRKLLSTGAYRWMLAVCGAFLLRFGPYFIYSGGRFLLSL